MNRFVPLGALLRRELITQLRRVRPFVLLLIFVLIVLLTIVSSWPSARTTVWSMLPFISRGLLTGMSISLLTGAALFIPGIAGTGIVTERLRGSWDLLALTQLRPTTIVFGKWLSAVGVYLFLVMAMMPLFATIFFLVGVDFTQVLVSLILVLATSLTCGATGVFASVVCRKTNRALSVSYALMVFVMGLPNTIVLGILMAFSMTIRGQPLPYFDFLMFISSPYPSLVGFTMNAVNWTAFLAHLGYQACIAVVALFVAVRMTRRSAQPVPEDSADASAPRERLSLRKRIRRRFRRRRPKRPPVPDRRNPIAVKERWWGAAAPKRLYTAPFLILLGISLFLVYSVEVFGGGGLQEIGMASLILHGIIVCTVVTATLGGLFTVDIESGSVDMLRMTLLTPRSVVRGKFLVGFRLAGIVSLSSLVANAPLMLYSMHRNADVAWLLLGHAAIALCAFVAATLALASSAVSRATSTGVVGGFAAVLTVFFGIPFGIVLILQFLRAWFGLFRGNEWQNFLLFFSSPVVGYFTFLERANVDSVLVDLEFLYLWSLNVVEFLVFSCLVYVVVSRYYQRRRMQDR